MPLLQYSREFLTLINCASFTAAALRLNLSQPTLSRHIATLEKSLGFKLFNRNNLTLTPAGKYYAEFISDEIVSIDQAINRGRHIADNSAPSIAVSMIPAEAPYSDVIYQTISRMRKSWSDIDVTFVQNPKATIEETVQTCQADIGIILAEPQTPSDGLNYEWLLNTHFDALIHKDAPIANKEHIEFEELSGLKLVRSTNKQFHTWYDGMFLACQKKGFEPQVSLKTAETKTDLILSLKPDEMIFGSGISDEWLRYNPQLRRITFNEETLYYSAYLVYREPINSLVKSFIDICHDIANNTQNE